MASLFGMWIDWGRLAHVNHPLSLCQNVARSSRFHLHVSLLVLDRCLTCFQELDVLHLDSNFDKSVHNYYLFSHLGSTACASWPTVTSSSNLPTLVQTGAHWFLLMFYPTMEPIQEQWGIYFSRTTLVSTCLSGQMYTWAFYFIFCPDWIRLQHIVWDYNVHLFKEILNFNEKKQNN